ncbi:hypothetical protein AMAG_01022 [Allomyces macrogynus ATCC 38327]|uniref:Uncharacterized protein n=1 Tax=Allomyces macrogynus (strain ATCC 38327) TaxID=578462 RepID=A0A0L0RXN0_ALLM3|nr:hypothetical protein AMAG_01022 [Allomyces macrogynus ATCC 38327]|eukprot:KNE55088.1 hypothetical protein AMAG_01022 [Allomyces macrogynus ATCC 38327]
MNDDLSTSMPNAYKRSMQHAVDADAALTAVLGQAHNKLRAADAARSRSAITATKCEALKYLFVLDDAKPLVEKRRVDDVCMALRTVAKGLVETPYNQVVFALFVDTTNVLADVAVSASD